MIGFGSSAGAKPLAEHVQVVALYEPANGHIAHLHMVTTLGDAEPLAPEEAIDEARRRAGRRLRNVEKLEVALSNKAEHCQGHRIDPATKSFVALTQERPGRGKAPSAS